MVDTLTPEQFKTHILGRLKTRFDNSIGTVALSEATFPGGISLDTIWQNISAKVESELRVIGGDVKNAKSNRFTLTSEKVDKMAALFEDHYFGEDGLVSKLASEIGKEAKSAQKIYQKSCNVFELCLDSIGSIPDNYGEKVTGIFADDLVKMRERSKSVLAWCWGTTSERMDAVIAEHVPAGTKQAAENLIRDAGGVRWGRVGATVAATMAVLGGIGYLLTRDKGKKEEQPKTWTTRTDASRENVAQRSI